MKSIKVILIPLLLVVLAFSCEEKEEVAALLVSSHIKKVELIEFSAETHLPGMESNLKKSIKYTLEFKCELTDVINFESLLIDSVKIPFSSIIVDGENRKRDFKVRPGAHESIKLTGNRLILIPNHPNPIVNEIVLERNVMGIEGKEGYVLYTSGENHITMPLGEYKDKGTIAHP